MSQETSLKMEKKREYKVGLGCALACSLIWGVLPIYWKLLQSVNPLLIMFYRLVLCFIFVLIVNLITVKWKGIWEPLKKKGVKSTFFLAGILISSNWGIYIWAVNSGFILQTSIGYYIEPLMVCVFGVLFFHEKLDIYKTVAFVLAVGGVLFMIIAYGELPIISIGLAVTFATYAAIKKKVQVNALLALLYETMFLVPLVVPIIAYMEFTGQGAFTTATPVEIGILSLCGVLTAVPLMLFAMAANRIDMVTLGVTEYISPTMGMVLGIFLYHEAFDWIQLVTFSVIWVGLIIFTLGAFKKSKASLTEEDEDKGGELTSLEQGPKGEGSPL